MMIVIILEYDGTLEEKQIPDSTNTLKAEYIHK